MYWPEFYVINIDMILMNNLVFVLRLIMEFVATNFNGVIV